jgi:hypothetical protein
MMPRTYDTHVSIAPRGQVWEPGYNPDDYSLDSEHDPNWAGTAAVGAIIAFMGLLAIMISPGVGVGFLIIGVIVIVASYYAGNSDIDWREYWGDQNKWIADEDNSDWETDWEQDARARQEMRQREIDEIIKAVKSTIRVRCQYCGTLNPESANKCESCGASL